MDEFEYDLVDHGFSSDCPYGSIPSYHTELRRVKPVSFRSEDEEEISDSEADSDHEEGGSDKENDKSLIDFMNLMTICETSIKESIYKILYSPEIDCWRKIITPDIVASVVSILKDPCFFQKTDMETLWYQDAGKESYQDFLKEMSGDCPYVVRGTREILNIDAHTQICELASFLLDARRTLFLSRTSEARGMSLKEHNLNRWLNLRPVVKDPSRFKAHTTEGLLEQLVCYVEEHEKGNTLLKAKHFKGEQRVTMGISVFMQDSEKRYTVRITTNCDLTVTYDEEGWDHKVLCRDSAFQVYTYRNPWKGVFPEFE